MKSKQPRSIWAALAALSLLITLLPLTSPAHAIEDGAPRRIFSGWIPYYNMKVSLPAAIKNKDLMSDVSPFWYSLKSATVIADDYTLGNPSFPMIDTSSRVTDTRTAAFADPLGQMHRAGLVVIPTLNDETGPGVLAGIISKPASRTTLINTLVKFATDTRTAFDGVDLDFEKFAYSDGVASWSTTAPNWVIFIRELSAALHARGKLLSIDTPPDFDPTVSKKGYWVYGWKDIGEYIDRLRIMGYDYSIDSPGPIGPLSWVDAAVKYAVSVMPASKVFLGVPGYGRDWVTNLTGNCPDDYQGLAYEKYSVTSASVAGGLVTYMSNNSLSNGQYISIRGLANPAYNLVDAKIYSRSKDRFTVKSSITAPALKGSSGTVFGYAHSVFSMNKATNQYSPYGGVTTYNSAFGETQFKYTRTINGLLNKAPTTCTVTREGWYQDAQGFAARANLISKYKIGGLAEWTIGQESDEAIAAIANVGRLLSVSASLTTEADTISYGSSTLVTASLKNGDGTPVSNVPIHFELSNSRNQKRNIFAGVTAPDGSVSQRITLAENSSITFISDSSWSKITGGVSQIDIGVTPLISWSAPSSMKRGVSYLITGQIQPKIAGQVVQLNGLATTTTDDAGRYTFTVSEKSPGFHKYQLLTQASSVLHSASTQTINVLVR
jgi:spore germination protein YaaH